MGLNIFKSIFFTKLTTEGWHFFSYQLIRDLYDFKDIL
jgi:hypothetical protein